MAGETVRGQRVYRGPSVEAWFDMNYPGVVKYALTSDDLGDALENLADASKAWAEGVSPRSNRPGTAADPHYADSWVTEPYIETHVGDPPFPRGAYTLANTSPHAVHVEYGTGRGGDDGHRIFARLIDFMRGHARTRR